VAGLGPRHDLGDDVGRDVLRQHGQPAAAGHGLGHPPAGDRRHVGDDDGMVVPTRSGVVRSTSSREPTVLWPGHHEDVGVGEVGGRAVAAEEAHGTSVAHGRPGTRPDPFRLERRAAVADGPA
jgi:hypothetical protein